MRVVDSFSRDVKLRDEYMEHALLICANGGPSAARRTVVLSPTWYKLAYDFRLLLSYSHEAIERMMARNTDL